MRASLKLVVVVAVLLMAPAFGQTHELVWAEHFGGTEDDRAHGVAVDASGNVYTVGRFTGTVDFDPGPGTFNLTSVGSGEGFISVLDSAGNFLWAAQLGGRAGRVLLDAGGNVYAVGSFWDTADFDPGPGTFSMTSAGQADAFVSVLDSAGNFVWARQFSGTEDVGAYLALDASGNLYLAGNFWGTADFDPGPGTFNLTSAGGYDVFVSALDSAGNFLWAARWGNLDFDLVADVAVDSSGNVYTVGFFAGVVDFDPGPGSFTMTSGYGTMGWGYDAFVSVLDSAGDFVWARQFAGADGGDWERALAVALDSSDNVYTAGIYEGTADFDPGPGTYNLTSEGGENGFISVLDSAGNFLWAKLFGGTASVQPIAMALDSNGNVYTVGSFSGTADFDPGPGTHDLTSAGSDDGFISVLNSAGNFVWAGQLGGVETDHTNDVALDAGGNVYAVGHFPATADFDPGPGSYNLTSAGSYDAFISMLGECFDNDGDGACASSDCDDVDGSVYPSAPQLCDGINNDCDHPAWPFLWDTNEFDDDDDGMTECAGDCNDDAATIYLGAPEICDGLDNDCDTVVDDDAVDAITWHPDADGDGFGDPDGPATLACSQPDGHAANNGDCDDGNATVYPDAPEILDGVDNQCPGEPGHGTVDEISGNTSFNSSEPPEYCWNAQAGATAYYVARASNGAFSSWCRVFTTTETCWADSMRPLPGETAYYLVCPAAPMVGSWGQDSSGAERTGICPPNLVANGELEVWNSPTDPASWVETTAGGTVNEETSPADVFDGQRAARLTRTGSGVLNIVNAGIPLMPGQSYTLTFAAKSSAVLTAALQVRIRNVTRGEDLQDDGTWSTSTNFFGFDLDTGYARQALQLAVDPGHGAGDDVQLIIRHSNNAPNGSALWIDDVAIQSQ